MRLMAWLMAGMIMTVGTVWAGDAKDADPLDRMLGKADAPVTIIEYASMTCPHCAHLHEQAMPGIKADWIETGKAKLIYRDFPTSPAGMSVGVSMITQCAPKEQYFPILALLFKAQDRWMHAPDPLTEIKRTVGLAGISPSEIDTCLQRQDLGDAIQARAEKASTLYKISSTPTLLVDGEKIEGAQTYADVKKVLDAAYAKAVKK